MLSYSSFDGFVAFTLSFPLAVVIAVELYLRLKYRSLLWIRVYPQVYVPDEDLGYRYRPNTVAEIRIAGIHRRFRINNKGFCGRDFVAQKTLGCYRIALVGTSNTTGIWMDGQGRNFSEMLEELLRTGGHNVEVMNFGIDGRYRAVHELRLLEKDVASYRPDLILIDVDIPFIYGFFRRDVYKGYVMIYNPETEFSKQWCEAQINYITIYKAWGAVYKSSYIIRALARYYMNKYPNSIKAHYLRIFVENRVQAPDVVTLPYSLKRSVEALQVIRDKLALQGSELVVFQYWKNPYYATVTSKYGLSYIELDVPPIGKYVHDLDGHYRYEGHVEIAKQLFDRLTERWNLEKARYPKAELGQ